MTTQAYACARSASSAQLRFFRGKQGGFVHTLALALASMSHKNQLRNCGAWRGLALLCASQKNSYVNRPGAAFFPGQIAARRNLAVAGMGGDSTSLPIVCPYSFEIYVDDEPPPDAPRPAQHDSPTPRASDPPGRKRRRRREGVSAEARGRRAAAARARARDARPCLVVEGNRARTSNGAPRARPDDVPALWLDAALFNIARALPTLQRSTRGES